MPRAPAAPAVHFAALRAPELAAATRLLAAGMRDNPLHVAVFGPDPDLRGARLAAFFAPLVAYVLERGAITGCWHQGRLIGLCGALPPGTCQPRGGARLALAARLMLRQPPRVGWRAARWLHAWAALDPPSRHWHLGPMTVAREWRRRGFGQALLGAASAHAAPGEHLWLETDLEANVRLYRRSGFTVVHETSLLGVRNWFMQRAGGSA